MITALPDLRRLGNPHLLVTGPQPEVLLRALVASLAPRGRLLVVADLPTATEDGGRHRGLHRLDLLQALQAVDEGPAKLRDLARSLVGADATALACLDQALQRHGFVGRHRRAAGAVSLRCRLPPATRVATWRALLIDATEHADRRDLPPPRLVDGSGQPVALDRSTDDSATGAWRLQLAVAEDADWRPYMASGLLPDLDAAEQAAGRAAALAVLRQQPYYAAADDRVLADLIDLHGDWWDWVHALHLAGPGPGEPTLRIASLLEDLREAGHSDLVGRLRAALGGDLAWQDPWATTGGWVFPTRQASDLRLACLIDLALATASRQRAAVKYLLLGTDLDHLPLAHAAVTGALRTARKAGLHLVLVAAAPPTGCRHLFGNHLAGENLATGGCHWTWSCGAEPQPWPAWFDQDHIGRGEQILYGWTQADADASAEEWSHV